MCDQAAVIRFFYVVMQLLGLAVVHFGASMDQGLLGPELTRMLLAIGMGLQWVEPIRILTRHPEFGELYQMARSALLAETPLAAGGERRLAG